MKYVVVEFDKWSGCPVGRTSFAIYEDAMAFYGERQDNATQDAIGVHLCVEGA